MPPDEARIYWNASTGEIDFSAPHATVSMNNPTAAARYSWQSGSPTDGQTCLFTIRIATAPWPDGVETQNENEQAATANSGQPPAPKLTAGLV